LEHTFNPIPYNSPIYDNSVISVDRAITDLRKGRCVVLKSKNCVPILFFAAETITKASINMLQGFSGSTPLLGLSPSQVKSLKHANGNNDVLVLKFDTLISQKDLKLFTESPSEEITKYKNFQVIPLDNDICVKAGLKLAKLGALLPVGCFAFPELVKEAEIEGWRTMQNLLAVEASDIFNYKNTVSNSLQKVSEARVPLKNAEDCSVSMFRPLDGSPEHIAVAIGKIDIEKPVLTRIHSECFTGDLLRSLRCDCGDQLHGAIKEISEFGSGILLYLRQEGRGIGLANKLRSYEIQDRGADTFDANEEIGFEADERTYLPAAKILQSFKIKQIRLMTNNPDKIKALKHFNFNIVERVPHSFRSNKHNETYLKAKKNKGHLLE